MEAPVTPDAIRALIEAGCLGGDPIPWLIGSAEPYARWASLTHLFGCPDDDPDVVAAHAAVLADTGVQSLLSALPKRFAGSAADHHNPQFLPNRLNLLADMGLARGDSEQLDNVLELLVGSQDKDGRFLGGTPARPDVAGASPRCDNNAIAEVLVRFGYADDPRVTRAVSRMTSDAGAAAQGRAWCCEPAKRPLVRLPGRRLDACPQITLEGLRTVARLPWQTRPRIATAAAATPLEIWRRRMTERPYQFGHGYQFKTVRWPSYWYDVLAVVDTVGRYPELWRGKDARPEDRTAVAELAACLIAYNVDSDGKVTPRRVQRGYESFSFGDKTAPSPFATVRVLTALARVFDLAEEIATIDVETLPSSKGGSGTAVPPERKTATVAVDVCPMPASLAYDPNRVLPRVLTRQHLDLPWEQASPESVVADVVGLVATDPVAPYLSTGARIPDTSPDALERSLDHRHSLVRWRGMRGLVQAFRRDFVPAVHAATSPQVIRYARDYAKSRGVEPKVYAEWAPRVLEACGQGSLSVTGIRQRLQGTIDLGAVVGLMTAEGLLVRSRPDRGRADKRMLFAAREVILPGMDLKHMTQDEARAHVLRAYVRGYGPVTRKDAAWWTGMDLKRVDRAMEALEDELVEIALKGHEGTWLMHAADTEELERAALLDQPSVAVLPANDPLMIGYADRSRFLDDAARPYVFDRANNAVPVVLVGGRVAAVWDVRARASEASDTATEVLVFAVAPLDSDVLECLRDKLTTAAGILSAAPVRVVFVPGMRSLAGRAVGSYAHPLR